MTLTDDGSDTLAASASSMAETVENGAKGHSAPLVVPLAPMIAPLRFGIVAQLSGMRLASSTSSSSTQLHHQSLFKGSFPRARHLPFLSRLKLKSILSLTPKPIEVVDKGVLEWCREGGIHVHHIRCDKPKDDGGGLSREGAAKALMVSEGRDGKTR